MKFSDGSSLKLYRQTVEDFRMFPGMEIEDLDAVRESNSRYSAKMRAVRIVSASAVSKRDLENRLVRKGESQEQAKAAVQWLSDLNLVDDVWITFEQGNTKITKKKSLEQITTEDKICTLTLTQAETASFDAYSPIAVQARWLTWQGEADSSTIDYISLGDVLEEGEI